MSDHLDVNRALWDSRAAAHATSSDYGLDRFRGDRSAISDVVRFDRPLLGDVSGLRTVHLQCHIGTDTLSLHRLGADVVGLDLSPASLEQARGLAHETGAGIEYVESDVYGASDVLAVGSFDLVYTGIGALCWLPSIDRWAETVASLLRPGGRLFVRDMHPMLAALDVVEGAIALQFPYFEVTEPLVFTDGETYAETDVELPALPSREWSHGIGETVSALSRHGLRVGLLAEHDSVPWVPLPGFMAPHPDHPGEFRLAENPERLAASFTITATKA